MEEQWRKWMQENAPKNLVAEMESSLEWSAEWRDKEIKRLQTKLNVYENRANNERRFNDEFIKKLDGVDARITIKENVASETAEAKLYDLFNKVYNAASKTLKDADDLLLKLIMEDHEIEQMCGKALGYQWYKDDLKNFPSATEADGVCTGEHVSASIVDELANKFERLHKKVMLFKQNEDNCQEMSKQHKDKEHVLIRLTLLKDIYDEAGLK
jgi:hypothetical protein